MNHDETVPSWGVLAKVGQDQMRYTLAVLKNDIDLSHLAYHSKGEWTAAFYTELEISDSGYDGAAELLRISGFVPVYQFDFSRYEYLTFRWDGLVWAQDDDPGEVLGEVGLWIPGWSRVPIEPDPSRAVVERRATVVEHATVDEVAALVNGTSIAASQGPLGAVAYDLEVDTHIQLWECAPNRVFEVLYYPDSADFCLAVMKGDNCLGTFKPGETRTWDGTPFLPDFEGETTAEGVLEKLGIPRSFLDPLPPKATDPEAGNK
jgi:hypothetical protein